MNRRKNSKPQKRNKLRVVHHQGGAPDPVSTLSPDEQARVLWLADVALHNATSDNTPAHAGDRARDEHERLRQELRDAVDRFERQRKNGAA
jgi:hypothetical protein